MADFDVRAGAKIEQSFNDFSSEAAIREGRLLKAGTTEGEYIEVAAQTDKIDAISDIDERLATNPTPDQTEVDKNVLVFQPMLGREYNLLALGAIPVNSDIEATSQGRVRVATGGTIIGRNRKAIADDERGLVKLISLD